MGRDLDPLSGDTHTGPLWIQARVRVEKKTTASIHSLSRVRLKYSSLSARCKSPPRPHSSNYLPLSPQRPGVAHTVERWEYATLPRDPSRTTPASRTRKWCIILSLGLGRSSRAVRACPLSPHGNARLAAPQGVPRSDVVTEKYAAPGKVFSNDGSSHHSYQKRPTLTYGAIPSGPPGTKHTK